MDRMERAGRDNWYRMDNVSKVFLATYTNRDTRSMRFCCTLKEPVNPEALEKALHKTIKARPQFQVRIRRGLFWHYLETTDAMPTVSEESGRPCPTLYGPGHKGVLHYKVSYFRKRINLEVFHGISDGMGCIEFLNQLVLNYFKNIYPEALKDITVGSSGSARDLEENSFQQFYTKYEKGLLQDIDQKMTGQKAYHIGGVKLPHDQLQFMEIKMSAPVILKKAKELKVSVTSYIGASLMLALYQDMPLAKRKLPITISIPVNLRNFYPSETVRNFFNSISVSHSFQGDETLETLALEFNDEMKKMLEPESMKQRMDSYQKLEKVFVLRMVPLAFKLPVVRAFCKKEAKKVSAVISNMGVWHPPVELLPYIDSYSAFCSHNELFMTITSLGDRMQLGITTAYQNTGVLKNLVRGFALEDDTIQVDATEVIL